MLRKIDEMTNEDLERLGHSDHILRYELDRVERLISKHSLTGTDLDHWFERSRILRSLILSGTRVGN